jgi:hypothetical protein
MHRNGGSRVRVHGPRSRGYVAGPIGLQVAGLHNLIAFPGQPRHTLASWDRPRLLDEGRRNVVGGDEREHVTLPPVHRTCHGAVGL